MFPMLQVVRPGHTTVNFCKISNFYRPDVFPFVLSTTSEHHYTDTSVRKKTKICYPNTFCTA